jgi:glucose-1-phosphate cytidylyltransferase
MKVVILAGGLGSRLSEETTIRPKPMVEIGGKPILWHIMKCYAYYGFDEFLILCGYKGYMIKEYFVNYYLHQADITVNLADNVIQYHNNKSEAWKVTLVDTGVDTMTGGRIKRVKDLIGNNTFMLTYGDGVCDLDIRKLAKFHSNHGKLVTITTVQPEGRFGSLKLDPNQKVESFLEKPKGDGSWINGGFFVCEPGVFDYITGDQSVFEKEPLENLAADGQLYAYKYSGFWKPMDTIRDKMQFEELVLNHKAPWMKW